MARNSHIALPILLVAALGSAALLAQPPAEKLEFEAASVKPSKSGDAPGRSSFPLGPGSVYTSTGGRFTATNFPLVTYIAFAYKVLGNQTQSLVEQMPGWALTDRFDIEAVAAPSRDTKDQMRLMMRSLLADRFKLEMRTETQQVPVFALLLLKPGKSGPRLQAHPEHSCVTNPPPPDTQLLGVYPALCGGLLPMPPSGPGLAHLGARDVTMAFLANQLTAMGALDRPVLDRTGLTGTFDFALEWAPANPQASPAADVSAASPGLAFLDAVQEQLGLKLVSQKGPVDVLKVAHVERPTGN